MGRRFRDRVEAGAELAERLAGYQNRDDVVVLALPRGGVPVGFEVARRLKAAFDVYVVRKLGVPGHEELAMGAIASGGVRVLNHDVIDNLGITDDMVERVAREEQAELERREQRYRDGRSPVDVDGRVAIVVDDGLATGATMRAAAAALRLRHPARLVVAVPTGATPTCAQIEHEVDEVVCAYTPSPFYAVGMSYEDFSQTTDDEVRRLLQEAAAWA